MAGTYTNQLPVVQPSAVTGANYFNVNGYERLPLDTEGAAGVQPQTVAATAFQVAAIAAAAAAQTASATAGAATKNTNLGVITSESISTAAGSNYTLTLTNSVVTATSAVQAAAYLGTSTAGGPLQVVSVTPASGSVVIVVKNAGTAALNGTIVIPYQVLAD